MNKLLSRTVDSISQRMLLVALVLLISAAGIYFSRARTGGAGTNLGLAIEPLGLTLGEVDAQEDYFASLVISNANSEPIEITKFHTSCVCTQIEPSRVLLKPGEVCTLMARLNFFSAGQPGITAERVPFEVTIVPEAKSQEGGILGAGWRLSGSIVHKVRPDSLLVAFAGANSAVKGKVVQQVIGVECDESIRLIRRAETADAQIDVHIQKDQHLPRRWIVQFAPRPEIPIGSFQDEIHLVGILEDDSALPAVPIKVTGNKVGEMEVLPGILNFGMCSEGDTRSLSCEFRSRVGNPFAVSKIDVGSESLSVELLDNLRVGETVSSCTIRVSKHFNENGSWKSHVTVAVDCVDGSSESLRLPVVAHVNPYSSGGVRTRDDHVHYGK